MTRPSTASLAGIVALLLAIAIWIWYAIAVVLAGPTTGEPLDVPVLIAVIGVGCLLDALIAARAVRRPVGTLALIYLGLRALLSAAGLLFATLPSYAVAAFALSRARRREEIGDRDHPHGFRTIADPWHGVATRHGVAMPRKCAICGEDEQAAIHGPTDGA